MKLRIAFLCLLSYHSLLSSITTFSQTQVSPVYSVDGTVSAMTTHGDTLIAAGSFGNTGIHTGGASLFPPENDKPILTFPKILGNVTATTSDGVGGFYVYGVFKKETETFYFSYPRIEHIRSDYSYDTTFSIPINALFGVNKLLYHNGLLYIGGTGMYDINKQVAGDLAAIDVATRQLVSWIPAISSLGGVSGLYVQANTLYIFGSFTDVGGLARRNIAAIEIGTGTIKAWDFAANWPNSRLFTDIKFYKDKMVISGDIDDGTGSSNTKHGCAVTDTLTGSTVDYVFISKGLFGAGPDFLYFAARVTKLAIEGDVLFAYSGGTFDTRVVAVNLAANNQVLWAKYFNMQAGAYDMKVSGGALYIVGDLFTHAYKTNFTNDDTANIQREVKNGVKLNALNGALHNWNPAPLGPGLSIEFTGLPGAIPNILVAGKFSYVNFFERRNIVMVQLSTQKILPFATTFTFSNINALKIIDSILYAAGSINYVNVASSKSVVAFNLNTGATTPWSPPGLGTAFTIEGNGNTIFLGGPLSEPSGGSGRTNLFAIDRTTGELTSWAPNPNHAVHTLHLTNGLLYAGGAFTNIASSARNYVASFDTINLALSAWNPNPDGQVNAITSYNKLIWIGGHITNIGGAACNLYGGVNEQTGLLKRANKAGLGGGPVNALQKAGCYMIAGGSFKTSSGTCNGLAMYNLFNLSDVSERIFCQNINDLDGDVKALTVAGRNLLFGGTFTKVNGKANATNIERLQYPPSIVNECEVFVTVKNGDYHDPTTWDRGIVPPVDARVIVRHKILVTADVTCFALETRPNGEIIFSGARVELLETN